MLKLLITAAVLLSAPLAAEKTVLALAGSTRENSFNKALAKEAGKSAAEAGAKVRFVDLKDYPMPLYNEDAEKSFGMPDKAKELRRLMLESDAIIIASPEYNASVTAVLKNTLDWASRTEEGEGSNAAFKGKKFAIMSASPGQGGGKRGILHLQAILQALGGEVVAEHVLVGKAHEEFDVQGRLTNPYAKSQLKQEVASLLN